MPLTPLAARYDQFILDLDGCVWIGGEPTPGVVDALEDLRGAGKRFAFATNNAFESGEDLVAQLWKIGIRASLGDVVTVGGAMQFMLAEGHTGRTAFVIGSPAMHRHVADAGLKVLNGTDLASRAEVVVVGGTTDLVYADLRNAVQAVVRGADLLATARDPTYPQPDGLWPGTGAILAAVEYATNQTAEIVGKPEPQLFVTALDRLGDGSTLVVGDRVGSDLAAAAAAGLDAALVRSASSDHDDLDGFEPQPVQIGETLAGLLNARLMRERLRSAELGYAVLAMAASSLFAALALHLWDANLGVPFAPGGDGYLALLQIKGELDTGWVLNNPHLGAPFGLDLHDYAANRELLHVLVVDLLGLFSSNPAAVHNAYFLLSFPLVGLVAYLVLRWIGLSRPAAAAMAVLYALTPFHFRHQTFLWAYYTVPLAAYLILAVYSGKALFENGLRSRRSLLTLAAAAGVVLSSFYFAGFTVMLVLLAGLITFAVTRRRAVLVSAAAIGVAIVCVGALAEAPALIYRVQHGANPVVAKRGAAESQLYSTNVLQLVMPVESHRLGPLRHLNERWQRDTKIDGERTHLGLIAALGFVWLVALAVAAAAGAGGRFIREERHRHLAVATATAFLLGTTGGISGLIAYGISPQFRSWTRLSVFLAFFALAAVGLLLDAGLRALRARGVRIPAVAVAVGLAGLCAVGFLDQTTSRAVPAYAANAAAWDSDADFARAIETQLGEGASVYQLPYVQFPESKPVNGTGPYDHARPYLHTSGLDWSFAAMRGRDSDWQSDTAGGPPEQLVPALTAAGFDGIYVDRAGYPDLGAALDAQLQDVTGASPLTSRDSRFAFYDLRPYAQRQRAELTPAELEALGDATIHPVRTEWTSGFSDRDQQGVDSSHWAVEPNPTLTLVNPSDSGRRTDLFVRLTRTGGPAATVTVTYPDRTTERVQVPPEGVELEHALRLPPGRSALRLEIDGPEIAPEGGPTGYLQLLGWRLTRPA